VGKVDSDIERKVYQEYHGLVARGWNELSAFEVAEQVLRDEAARLGVFIDTDAEVLQAVSAAIKPTVRVPPYRRGTDDVLTHIDRVWDPLINARRPLDRRFIEHVLRKMRRLKMNEVAMLATDWAELKCSDRGGIKALERVCRIEVQPYLIRTREPKSRVCRAIARDYVIKKRIDPPYFYRLRMRAPAEETP
jgi:hypothetical protein